MTYYKVTWHAVAECEGVVKVPDGVSDVKSWIQDHMNKIQVTETVIEEDNEETLDVNYEMSEYDYVMSI